MDKTSHATPLHHIFRDQSERAENGALDPWSLDLCLGRPPFP